MFPAAGSSAFLGTFIAPAANESGCLVEAALYWVELDGEIAPLPSSPGLTYCRWRKGLGVRCQHLPYS